MGRRRVHVPLNVFLNSRLVGVLRREATGAIDFQYGRDWLDWRGTFPVSLSLPLREDRYIGAPVINVFDNLLPDSDLIRKRVAERVGAEGTDPFSMLTALGHDCVGALHFLPDGTDPGTAGDITGKPVSDDEVADIVKNLTAAPLGMGVLVRQRPGSAKGVMFITIEDETGIASLLVWVKVFKKFRSIVLSAGMLAIRGRIQLEGDIVHLVAKRLTDLSSELASVGDRNAAFPLPHGRGDDFHHGSPAADPRSVPKGMKVRDFFDPHGHIDTIKVKTRDFR
ncbi:MAG TPA: HipA N-terminal domain-containing protein [Phyllobacterium sp.]|nr:HipA N-terminal domain-containing protein [Phyllobacterium sp.]